MPKISYLALNLEHDFTKEVKQVCDKIQEVLKEKGYEFIPMEQENLHMTLVFLGSILNTDRNNKIKEIVPKICKFEGDFNEKILEFDNFELFPNEKRNLVVAKFKCNDRNFVSDMIKFKKSFCAMGAKEENYFTPHITLGKIQNIKPDKKVSGLLPFFPKITSNIEINGCHLVDG